MIDPRFGEFEHQGGGHDRPPGVGQGPHHYGPPGGGGGGGGGGGPGMYSGWVTGYANTTPGWRPGGGGNRPDNDHGPVFNKSPHANPFGPGGGPAGPVPMPTLGGGMGQNWTSPGNYNAASQNPFAMLGPGNQLVGGNYLDQLDPWQMLFLNKLMGGMY